jgi:hypothetical protein
MRGGVPPHFDVCALCGAYSGNCLHDFFCATQFSKTPCIIATFLGVKKNFHNNSVFSRSAPSTEYHMLKSSILKINTIIRRKVHPRTGHESSEGE